MRSALIDRHNAAVELRKQDRFEEALAEFEAIIRSGLDAPETLMMRAHLLGDLGRYDDAIAAYRALLDRHPDVIDAHETLAMLLPQLGREPEALDAYRDALARAPDRGMLWVSAMNSAKALHDHTQLLDWCDAAEVRFGVDEITSSYRAQALSALGEDDKAADLIEHTIAAAPSHAALHTTQAHIALKRGQPDQAMASALKATQLDRHDQTGWALLATALRLLDDPRELWLTDYQQHIQTIDLSGLDLVSLIPCLNGLHITQDHPGEQSVRGGTQTRGNLFDRRLSDIVALRETIADAVADTLKEWGNDQSHPFTARNTGRFQFGGSWSVRLRSEGFHINHIHPAGWVSSACYIALPDEVGTGDAGALAFGCPDTVLGLNLPPRRIVRPRSAMLVLFPSFMWHGTIPFESKDHRMTVAFDIIPS